MKVEMGSYPNSPQPTTQATGILSSQQAQKDLHESIMKLLKHLQQHQEQNAAAAAYQQQMIATLNRLQMQKDAADSAMQFNAAIQMLFNEQLAAQTRQAMQEQLSAGLPPQGLGQQMPFPGNSPLVPYLLAELANKGSPPPNQFTENRSNQHSPPAPEPTSSKGALIRHDDGSWHRSAPGGGKGGGRAKDNKAAARANSGVGAGGGVAKSSNAATQDYDSHSQDSHPQDVRAADGHRTFVALKINRLGFDAENLLKEHFSQFGQVDYVCVPLKVKRVHATANYPSHSHLRPSGLGFVVMTREEDVQAVLASGPEQLVCDKVINVRAFKQGEHEQV